MDKNLISMKKMNGINIDKWRVLNKTLFEAYVLTYSYLEDNPDLNAAETLIKAFEEKGILESLTTSGYGSAYTIAREIGIYYEEDGKYVLSNMSKAYNNGKLTYQDYLKYYCLNIEFLINNDVIHPFTEILEVLNNQSFDKNEIAQRCPKLVPINSPSSVEDCLRLFLNRCVEAELLISESGKYKLNFSYDLLKGSINKSSYEPNEFENTFIVGDQKIAQKNIVTFLLEREIKQLFINSFNLISSANFKKSTLKTNSNKVNPINKIYFGAPGTGKSYRITVDLKDIDTIFQKRITFHPEYDNSSFVGGYKPITDSNGDIKYEFVPQIFTNIYKEACNDPEHQYYLIIEEINRGNCAEIFGELFQLLDRDEKYKITPSNELIIFLNDNIPNSKFYSEGEMLLPDNLSILATMNTSDQSLFPMDSAFKRRWEWEYIPICYNPIDELKKSNISFDYEIDIEDGEKYSWIKFIEKINLNHIKENQSLGMDKCIGNYFVKPDINNTISLRPFINKVIFYLWNDVFKDEENKVFQEKTSYEDFFPINTNGKTKVKELFERIDLKPKPNLEAISIPLELGFAAEEEESIGS